MIISNFIGIVILLLGKWLESKYVPEPQRNMYTELGEVCMEQNIQFNEKFYRQNQETAMRNPLSGFLTELSMSNFEMEMKRNPMFPRI